MALLYTDNLKVQKLTAEMKATRSSEATGGTECYS